MRWQIWLWDECSSFVATTIPWRGTGYGERFVILALALGVFIALVRKVKNFVQDDRDEPKGLSLRSQNWADDYVGKGDHLERSPIATTAARENTSKPDNSIQRKIERIVLVRQRANELIRNPARVAAWNGVEETMREGTR